MTGLAKIYNPWEMEMIGLTWDSLTPRSEGKGFGLCMFVGRGS